MGTAAVDKEPVHKCRLTGTLVGLFIHSFWVASSEITEGNQLATVSAGRNSVCKGNSNHNPTPVTGVCREAPKDGVNAILNIRW